MKKYKVLQKFSLLLLAVGLCLSSSLLLLMPTAHAFDPNTNYLYGSNFNDCADSDFVMILASSTAQTAHCIHFSADTSTYSTRPTTAPNTCAHSADPQGGFLYNSKVFGPLCAYFKPD